MRCIVRKASSYASCSLNSPVLVLKAVFLKSEARSKVDQFDLAYESKQTRSYSRKRLSYFSSHLIGFHLPRSGKRKTQTKKKVLCPWKCFAPDLKLFENWLCKYAVSVFFYFSFFQHFGLQTERISAIFFYAFIPRFSFIFHLTAVTWVLVFNIDTAERKERQTKSAKVRHSSPLWICLKGIRNTLAVSIVKPLTKTASWFFSWKVVWKGKL